MRDSAGNADRYAEFFASNARREEVIATTPASSVEHGLAMKSQYVVTSKDLVIHQYGAGYKLDALRRELVERTDLMVSVTEAARASGEDDYRDLYALDGVWRPSVGFAGLALLLVSDAGYADRFLKLLSPRAQDRSYLMDILIKSFVPGYKLAKKYRTEKYASVWSDPLLRVLALPAQSRADALAAHMKNWCRIMRPWGWKPDLDTAPGKDRLFCDFAFEVALAVCAYDIDDSAFSDHPYYPRDLVEYYRAHVRHARDAWRAEGAGAGVPVAAPPPPQKADLAKSRRKAAARWVELVCDGQVDAIEAVLEAIGKPRKFEDVDGLMAALSDVNQAIHADIKDDETLAIQAARLAEDRGLEAFDGPPGPPFGPARCTAILLAFATWLETRGYRLADLDNEDDAWHAVVVKAEYLAEFLELGGQLRLNARAPADIYRD